MVPARPAIQTVPSTAAQPSQATLSGSGVSTVRVPPCHFTLRAGEAAAASRGQSGCRIEFSK